MRLKTMPEDFVVREATTLRIRKQPGPYRVYMLEKKGWNTVDALVRIAKEKRVPYARMGYGGKKDRHAHTFQYVTVGHMADCTTEAKGYSLRPLGYSTEPMAPAKILMNHFELTLREMSVEESRRILDGRGRVSAAGVPNYFDDQRFGTYDRAEGFIAEKLLQGRWEDGLRLALTGIHSEEHKEAKVRKRALAERWGDWRACRELAVTAFEQRSFDLLLQKPGAVREALATVHRETALMWVSAYQSFLWNEVLRRLIRSRTEQVAEQPGAVAPYLFPLEPLGLDGLKIPLPGQGLRQHDLEVAAIFEGLMRERRLRPTVFDRELLPGVTFQVSPREAFIKPASFYMGEPMLDDRYPGKQKLSVRFSLPRGAYATMVVKALGLPAH